MGGDLLVYDDLHNNFDFGAHRSREEIDPIASSDTTAVTFQLTIRPILDENCSACHSGSSPANGLDYEKNTDVLTVASATRLAGAIQSKSTLPAHVDVCTKGSIV